jgi:hypothetical protein
LFVIDVIVVLMDSKGVVGLWTCDLNTDCGGLMPLLTM